MIPLLPDISVVVTVLIVAGAVTIVGLDRIWEFRTEASDRLFYLFPYILLLVCVLIVNSVLRAVGPRLSWLLNWQITDEIFALEGEFVAVLQSYATPAATVYFSYTYIYGYVFLLVFPVVAYLVMRDDRPVRETIISYALNYVIGVFCYLLFIAYGPRNVMPDIVDQLLYVYWPEANLLTTEVNANVNVFPSLHTSLAVTVALLAYRTREEYPAWLPISVVLALSVIVSTMYLGIHWLTDVVAGAVLACISVRAAAWLTDPSNLDGRVGTVGRRLREPIDRFARAGVERLRKFTSERIDLPI
ncbi:phosphatase PAP2 family protein [Halovenus sp. WSH3]|uniref:Phosphatase PAP2 family protein n=1 Tax=Halovenus carboxidivorans TaxID=2692199 RepID=A0A6B0TBY4_9EURY|nr:phosphatase PAP2 family protein [Halovenus carboxidivorans]MXR52741.1 phosphatase PAP2 family protein [Halovenus carboxidivorans]